MCATYFVDRLDSIFILFSRKYKIIWADLVKASEVIVLENFMSDEEQTCLSEKVPVLLNWIVISLQSSMHHQFFGCLLFFSIWQAFAPRFGICAPKNDLVHDMDGALKCIFLLTLIIHLCRLTFIICAQEF